MWRGGGACGYNETRMGGNLDPASPPSQISHKGRDLAPAPPRTWFPSLPAGGGGTPGLLLQACPGDQYPNPQLAFPGHLSLAAVAPAWKRHHSPLGTPPWKAAALTSSSGNRALNAVPSSPKFASGPTPPQAASREPGSDSCPSQRLGCCPALCGAWWRGGEGGG